MRLSLSHTLERHQRRLAQIARVRSLVKSAISDECQRLSDVREVIFADASLCLRNRNNFRQHQSCARIRQKFVDGIANNFQSFAFCLRRALSKFEANEIAGCRADDGTVGCRTARGWTGGWRLVADLLRYADERRHPLAAGISTTAVSSVVGTDAAYGWQLRRQAVVVSA